jgi:hypothetical protein
MADLREEWGGACVWHGGECDGPLEFAHLPGKPTKLNGQGRGLPQRYHDVRANPDSYVLVCRRHHAELDGRGGRTRRTE